MTMTAAADLDLSNRIIVVAGAPCSGKGTQCKLLSEKFGLQHISTGDLFREHVERGTNLGVQVKEYLDKRCFVPDELVVNLVRDKLRECSPKGALLDGFPRTGAQAEALQRLVKIDSVLFLEANDKALVQRAPGRRIDPSTGNIYHLKFVEPPTNLTDFLVVREGDGDTRSFQTRLDVFRGQIRRVLPYFSGRVHRIDALQSVEEVHNSVVKALQTDEEKRVNGQTSCTASGNCAECAICFTAEANFLCVPCGHQCGCEECLNAVKRTSGICPICRAPVQSLQRVYAVGGRTGATEENTAEVTVAAAATQKQPVIVNDDQNLNNMAHPDLDDKLDQKIVDEEWPDDVSSHDEDEEDAAGGVTLAIAPARDIIGEAKGPTNVSVSIKIPEEFSGLAEDEVIGTDVVCVVDVSGSMGTLAVESDGVVNKDGLSILDIVKHALKTVMHALGPQDRCALVGFSTTANTVFKLTPMTKKGLEDGLEQLEGMHPQASTNIWAGILAGAEALREAEEEPTAEVDGKQVTVVNRRKTLLLLTDGQPNCIPPRGHLAELREYKDKYPDFSFQINTFGFGYSLDSQLLLDLAVECGGTYAFIPDAVIVGTVFVNTIANALSTFTQSSTLSLCPVGASEFAGDVLGYKTRKENDTTNDVALVTEESWGRAINLGPLQLGQMREVTVPMRKLSTNDKNYLEAVLTFPDPKFSKIMRVALKCSETASTLDAAVGALRSEVVRVGRQAIQDAADNKKGKAAADSVTSLKTRVANNSDKVNRKFNINAGNEMEGRLAALNADLSGRMSKALQGQERFNRWGKHYLRALTRSHQLQQCTNFMDPGLQVYGGEQFRKFRDAGDQIFISLPPPKKSTHSCNTTRSSTPVTNMNTYYAGAGGGCFSASSTVAVLHQENKVPMKDVRKGELVLCKSGWAKVRCLVELSRGAGKDLVCIGDGLKITPKHPVFVEDKWILPRDLPNITMETQSTNHFVYNIVLEDGAHTLLVGGVACATWGHNLNGDIIEHEYFGTNAVIQDLELCEGFERAGFITINRDSTVVDQDEANLTKCCKVYPAFNSEQPVDQIVSVTC